MNPTGITFGELKLGLLISVRDPLDEDAEGYFLEAPHWRIGSRAENLCAFTELLRKLQAGTIGLGMRHKTFSFYFLHSDIEPRTFVLAVEKLEYFLNRWYGREGVLSEEALILNPDPLHPEKTLMLKPFQVLKMEAQVGGNLFHLAIDYPGHDLIEMHELDAHLNCIVAWWMGCLAAKSDFDAGTPLDYRSRQRFGGGLHFPGCSLSVTMQRNPAPTQVQFEAILTHFRDAVLALGIHK